MPRQKQYIYIKAQWYISVAVLMCCSSPCMFWFIGEWQSCRQAQFFSSHQRQPKANSRLWWGHESNTVTDRTISLPHSTDSGTHWEQTGSLAARSSSSLLFPLFHSQRLVCTNVVPSGTREPAHGKLIRGGMSNTSTMGLCVSLRANKSSNNVFQRAQEQRNRRTGRNRGLLPEHERSQSFTEKMFMFLRLCGLIESPVRRSSDFPGTICLSEDAAGAASLVPGCTQGWPESQVSPLSWSNQSEWWVEFQTKSEDRTYQVMLPVEASQYLWPNFICLK